MGKKKSKSDNEITFGGVLSGHTQKFIFFWRIFLKGFYLFIIAPINVPYAFLRINTEKRAKKTIELNVGLVFAQFLMSISPLISFFLNSIGYTNSMVYTLDHTNKEEIISNKFILIASVLLSIFYAYLIFSSQTIKCKRTLYWIFYFNLILILTIVFAPFVISIMGVLGIRLPIFGLEFYNTNPLFFLFFGTIATIIFYLTLIRIFYRGVKAIKFLEKENNNV